MRNIILAVVYCLSTGLIAQSATLKIDSTNFGTIYPHALRGEMGEVFKLLTNANNEALTDHQLNIKQQYFQRFLYKSEDFNSNTSDTVIIDLYDRFRNYWHSVIMEQVPLELADSLFRGEMMHFLNRNYKPDLSIDSIENNYYSLFQQFLEERDYHGLVMGKTGHLYDLYLWTNEEEVIYEVELPDVKTNITVVFMKDFVSNGWSHYTTFGRSFSGGWVGSEKIFCVEEAYDTESEQFKISYVAHEGQHFVDLSNYPNLKQADLEYRAKLTELTLAQNSIYDLVKMFIAHGKNDMSYAHPFANYLVIMGLSDSLFKVDMVSEIEEWKKIPVAKINEAAHQLLRQNSKLLKKAGSNVESVILN